MQRISNFCCLWRLKTLCYFLD